MEINAATNLTVHVPGGAVSTTWTIEADLMDRGTIKVPAGGAVVTLPIQPGPGNKILLLMLTASKYPKVPADGNLTFQFGNPPAGGVFNIKQPLVVSGADLVNTLNAAPTVLSLSNTGPADVVVDMLVIRLA